MFRAACAHDGFTFSWSRIEIKQEPATRRETVALCRMSPRQAAHLLKKMSDTGKIRLIGVGRNSHYVAM